MKPALLFGRTRLRRFTVRVNVAAVDRRAGTAFVQWADGTPIAGAVRLHEWLTVPLWALYDLNDKALPFRGIE